MYININIIINNVYYSKLEFDLDIILPIEIAPDPISKMNPIVNTIKNIKATLNPNVLT